MSSSPEEDKEHVRKHIGQTNMHEFACNAELSLYFTNTETRHTDKTNEVMGTVGFSTNNTKGLRQHEALL